jgi:hypothetical protein
MVSVINERELGSGPAAAHARQPKGSSSGWRPDQDPVRRGVAFRVF